MNEASHTIRYKDKERKSRIPSVQAMVGLSEKGVGVNPHLIYFLLFSFIASFLFQMKYNKYAYHYLTLSQKMQKQEI